MFKIRLSILLLASFFIFSCSANQNNFFDQKYSLDYIGGGFDGLLLKNYLRSSLKNLDIYDSSSNYEIKASISHNTNIYITNTDNTSNREKIESSLSYEIINNLTNCQILRDKIDVSQFYIYASADKFLSNQTALTKIKKDNTAALTRQFINKIKTIDNTCNE
jgi:hypothetical protein